MRLGSSKIAIVAFCGCYIFSKFIDEIELNIIVSRGLFIAIETDDLE